MPTPLEQAYIDTVSPLFDVSAVSDLLDPMLCPEQFLPALAYERHAETYSVGLLGVAYDRRAVRDAREIRAKIGYKEALDMFAANMEIEYFLTEFETGTGSSARVTEAEIRVSSLSPQDADATRATKFMNETFDLLLGWRTSLRGGTVVVVDAFEIDYDVRVHPTFNLHNEI